MKDSLTYQNTLTGEMKQMPSFMSLPSMENWKCCDEQMDMENLIELQPFFSTDVPTESTWFNSTLANGTDNISEAVSLLSLNSNRVEPSTNELCGPILKKMQNPQIKHAYILKFYSTQDVFKLNQVVDVIGIVDWNISSHSENNEQENEQDLFDKIPIIYVLHANQLDLNDIPSFYPEYPLKDNVGQDEWFVNCQNMLIHYMTNLLEGDELAAHYLLFYLLSRISSRHSGINSGYMTLNLCRISKSKTTEIFDFIRSVSPLVIHLPLSLTQLNSEMYMIPEMERDQTVHDISFLGLCSGRLQVANGTSILVDETVLESGNLQERGVLNLAHLAQVMDRALVPIQLGHGSTMELESDIKFLVASEGKSMFPVRFIYKIIHFIYI